MIQELSKVFNVTKGKLKFVILLFFRSPFDAFSTVVYATFMKFSFDAIVQNNIDMLNTTCIIFVATIIFMFAYNGSVWWIYAGFVTRVEQRLRRSAFKKISVLSLKQIEDKSYGEWITRLNTDVQLPFGHPMNLPHALCSIVNIAVSAVFLIKISVPIFLLIMLFVVPHILISQVFIASKMPDLRRKSLEKKADTTSEINTMILSSDTAAIYDAKDYFLNRFGKSNQELRKVNMEIIRLKAINSTLLNLFGMSGYFLLLIVSSSWIISGAMTFGDLTAAFQYRGGVLVGTIILINSLINIKGSKARLQRINEVMDMQEDVE